MASNFNSATTPMAKSPLVRVACRSGHSSPPSPVSDRVLMPNSDTVAKTFFVFAILKSSAVTSSFRYFGHAHFCFHWTA